MCCNRPVEKAAAIRERNVPLTRQQYIDVSAGPTHIPPLRIVGGFARYRPLSMCPRVLLARIAPTILAVRPSRGPIHRARATLAATTIAIIAGATADLPPGPTAGMVAILDAAAYTTREVHGDRASRVYRGGPAGVKRTSGNRGVRSPAGYLCMGRYRVFTD